MYVSGRIAAAKMTGLEQFTVRSRPMAWAWVNSTQGLSGQRHITHRLYHGVRAVEDNRSDQVGDLGAKLLVRVLADVQKQARIDTRAASRGGERENTDLGKVQDLGVVVDELNRRRPRCAAVVDVVKRSIARSGDDCSARAVEAGYSTTRRLTTAS
jgi:hypothetical protein